MSNRCSRLGLWASGSRHTAVVSKYQGSMSFPAVGRTGWSMSALAFGRGTNHSTSQPNNNDFKEQECLEVLQCSLCLRRIIYRFQLVMEVEVLHFVMLEELYFQSQWFKCVFTTGSPLGNKAGDILFWRLLLIQWKKIIQRAKQDLEHFAILCEFSLQLRV
jgi:hypothetical protein